MKEYVMVVDALALASVGIVKNAQRAAKIKFLNFKI
tara:strand:+ start:452 stop:559 length:108 start_codon:yes stop_codon:yes gene_type:complete